MSRFAHRLPACVVAALLGAVVASPALAAPPALPALMQPAVSAHHVGKPIFFELVTPDLAAAEQFYGTLFGWGFHAIPLGSTMYAQATVNGETVAGLVQRDLPKDGARHPAWISFLSAGDVDAAAAATRTAGGKVLFGPRDVPDRGRQAVLADPQGAIFAVLASSSGDPPDVQALPGEWIWASLITTDPDTDAAFYQTLFGYEVFETPDDPNGQHLMLASGGFARASANPLPEERPDIHPHWLGFIRVDQAADTVARAASLGGRVLVPPRPDRHGGQIAVIADPQGAVFGVLEWSGPDAAR